MPSTATAIASTSFSLSTPISLHGMEKRHSTSSAARCRPCGTCTGIVRCPLQGSGGTRSVRRAMAVGTITSRSMRRAGCVTVCSMRCPGGSMNRWTREDRHARFDMQSGRRAARWVGGISGASMRSTARSTTWPRCHATGTAIRSPVRSASRVDRSGHASSRRSVCRIRGGGDIFRKFNPLTRWSPSFSRIPDGQAGYPSIPHFLVYRAVPVPWSFQTIS